MRQFFVYILTNKNNTVLYTGVTNDLERRVTEHRSGRSPRSARDDNGSSLRAAGRCHYEHIHFVQCKLREVISFTAKYKVSKLVWYEEFSSPAEAIAAEKKIKAGSRIKKIKLIEEKNPDWNDLIQNV